LEVFLCGRSEVNREGCAEDGLKLEVGIESGMGERGWENQIQEFERGVREGREGEGRGGEGPYLWGYLLRYRGDL
jgi:hypothetical protein